ncbi:MAG: potassium transporter TrkA [Sulfurimonas sp. RIFOXYD12_FULL_36_11]|uniref:NAD-binding protein n=1 Tax=Sulfurimonas sp. RIFOXYB12_FULL_35_9 TaxID=1802256 RepID=UPI0008D526FB|nr:NAD-binding protein [Sulfurimonas sp. RIFOXYB12_FULL_35_9]OHE04200.1 MAG: potassium transporter TrkA [Sulfurimonas sp. RIFOXYB12_FULL_35_9]OHE20415.1 MAG: potassium transporter TrkA [Sulfurimonas sp. RIFOXYD12_FULL_36_11]
MKNRVALIFGYNDYALEIAKNIVDSYNKIYIYSLQSEQDTVKNSSEFEIRSFDLSDKWDDINEFVDIKHSIAFCVLEDNAENIFLTISLRSSFPDLNIIALSNNKETANKLQMAGANRVIPLVQTTAEMIAEMMEKPIVKEVFHNILFENSTLKIAQIRINGTNSYIGKEIIELDWDKKYGVIALSIMYENMRNEFIYSSIIKHYRVKEGDSFVIVGYEIDIKEFEKIVGSECD